MLSNFILLESYIHLTVKLLHALSMIRVIPGNQRFKRTVVQLIYIQELSDKRYTWESVTPPYSCTVASPKKDSKFKGM